MEIVKQKKEILTDVYTVGNKDFLTMEEAQEYIKKKEEMENIHLIGVNYAPILKNKKISYSKKFFLLIKKNEANESIRVEVLFSALAQLLPIYSSLFETKTFSYGFGEDKKEVVANGFEINQLNIEFIGDVDNYIQMGQYVNGKKRTVKAYKADVHGRILNLKKKPN